MPSPAYDETNIFAKILRGELPCHKVFEDDVALALMDIMPRADGHVLVLPKRPARNILDADPVVLGQLMTRVQKIARVSASPKASFNAATRSAAAPAKNPFRARAPASSILVL